MVDLIHSASLCKTEVVRLWLPPGLTGPHDTRGCARRSWGLVAQWSIPVEGPPEASGPGQPVRAHAGEADRHTPRREPPGDGPASQRSGDTTYPESPRSWLAGRELWAPQQGHSVATLLQLHCELPDGLFGGRQRSLWSHVS